VCSNTHASTSHNALRKYQPTMWLRYSDGATKTAKSDKSVAKYHRFEYLCNRLFDWQSSGGWVTSLQISNLKLSKKLL